eukprot:PhF_6_TR44486/c0_g1_i1/m.68503
MRRSCLFLIYTNYSVSETTYPYSEPFKNTPYEKKYYNPPSRTWPQWMDNGVDGSGHGIGLYRTHPRSKLKGNISRKRDHIPYLLRRMAQGVHHASGKKYIRENGRTPNPFKFPYLTGKPSSLTRWVHLEPELLRTFAPPTVSEANKDLYKPYVALHELANLEDEEILKLKSGGADPSERLALEGGGSGGSGKAKGLSLKTKPEEEPAKPLKKRLFFWR